MTHTPPTSPPSHLATRLQRAMWFSLALGLFWLLAALPLAWWDRQDRLLQLDKSTAILFKLWLYWAVWAIPPFMVAGGMLGLWQSMRSKQKSNVRIQVRIVCALLILGVGGWSSLIEPRLLRVQTHAFTTASGTPALKLAVVSDLHLGLFWRTWQLAALVEKINTLQVDAVLVAGDWTYEPPSDLKTAFAPLQDLKAPVYGVMGNHDLQAPGANYAAALHTALTELGVHMIDGQSIPLQSWTLVGIGDLWGDAPQPHIEQHLGTPAPNRLVLTHQPDAAAKFPADAAFLTFSGHTHGGQIRLPWLTQQVLQGSTEHPWYLGRYALPQGGQLFVTGGVGTIGLPARLGVMPSIELIELRPAP